MITLTSFVNKLLEGTLPSPIAKYFYGGTLIALKKKDGGIRPITIGYTLRRLVAKCANNAVIERVVAELAPIPVGVGVKGGSEASVHATLRFLASIRGSPDEVIVKLDFRNAFNCLQRDCMLEQVARMVPEIYAFCLNAYSGQQLILFNNSHIQSATGVQQGDPLGPLLSSITLQPILLRAVSELKVGYLDDVTIGGSIQDVETDVELIREHAQTIGLELNAV